MLSEYFSANITLFVGEHILYLAKPEVLEYFAVKQWLACHPESSVYQSFNISDRRRCAGPL